MSALNISLLRTALQGIKESLEHAIETATFRGESRANGLKTKESFIRSYRLIMPIHEAVKESLAEELSSQGRAFAVHPPMGKSSLGLKFMGFLKGKNQDVSVLFDDDEPTPEEIAEGPLSGLTDPIGESVSRRSLVIGVRSQMSSVNKNFDTLMERLFAETLNMRLRLPRLVMGEVYLLPVVEYDSEAMKQNEVAWERRPVDLQRFIRTFASFSGRGAHNYDDEYKYERSALVLADFREDPPKVYLTLDELKSNGLVSGGFEAAFETLSPRNFAEDLLDVHRRRHQADE
jgi:hypothetical protein